MDVVRVGADTFLEASDSAAFVPRTPVTIVVVDERLHPRRAVLRACYQMSGEADFILNVRGPDQLEVALRPLGDRSIEDLAVTFRRQLVDFTLRADVEERTGELRNLIWRTAFSEAVGLAKDATR